MRLDDLHVEGVLDDFARLFERRHVSQRDRLDEDIAGGGCFRWPDDDGNLQRIRSEMIEQAVFCAPAHQVQSFDFSAGDLFDLAQRLAVKERQALEDAADNGPGFSRDGLAGLLAECLDPVGRRWPGSRASRALTSPGPGRTPSVWK